MDNCIKSSFNTHATLILGMTCRFTHPNYLLFVVFLTFLPPRSMLTRSALRRAFIESDLLISIDCLISSLRDPSDTRTSLELVEDGSDISALAIQLSCGETLKCDVAEAKLENKKCSLYRESQCSRHLIKRFKVTRWHSVHHNLQRFPAPLGAHPKKQIFSTVLTVPSLCVHSMVWLPCLVH